MIIFNRIRPWVGLVARLGLGVVWIVAAVDKLRAPRTFVQAVRAYDATPEWLSKAIGYGLPVLEISVGILLVLGLVTRLAAAVSSVLFVVFLIGIIQAAARGIQLDCGCFGGGGTTDGGTTYTLDILRDIGLLIVAVFLVVWPLTRFSVDEFVARNDRVEQPSAKRMRTDKGRAKYNAMLEQRRKAAQSRNRWTGISIAAIVVLVAVIGIGVQSNRAKIQGSLTATNANATNGVTWGQKAAATVDVYEDFQCPICREFETTKDSSSGLTGQQAIDQAVRANKAQVRFHIMSFLDGSSTNNYSTRAANAALCVSDISTDDFVAFHNILYDTFDGKQVQNKEGTAGPTDQQLITYATTAKAKGGVGIPAADQTTLESCITGGTHKALVAAIQDKASQQGVTGTPTIKVNGKTVSATVAAFTKAVDAAVAKGPKPSPSPSAPSSPTPSVPGSSLPASTAPAPKTSAVAK